MLRVGSSGKFHPQKLFYLVVIFGGHVGQFIQRNVVIFVIVIQQIIIQIDINVIAVDQIGFGRAFLVLASSASAVIMRLLPDSASTMSPV